MCGVTGVLRFDGSAVDERALNLMTDQLAHRGPDGRGVYVNGPVGLGHRRLSVLDTTSAGSQPFSDIDGSVWLTYNGELYNYQSLKRELESFGYKFRTGTDTEVLLLSYKRWGRGCVDRLEGMFAFALWDAKQKQLWMVRDRIGIKPLFFSVTSKRVVFGSEIKSILAYDGASPTLDEQGLAYYLGLNYVPAPHTLFRGVRHLMPGHWLSISQDGRAEEYQYWDLKFNESEDQGETYYCDRLDALLDEAVESHLLTDVPYGLLLSGGMDSSAIAYYMTKAKGHGIETFSADFQETAYSEIKYAKAVSQHLGCKNQAKQISADAISILPEVVWHSEEPTADSSMLAYYQLCQMASEKITVALVGDGADEVLAGYETYSAWFLQSLFKRIPFGLPESTLMRILSVLPISDGKVSFDFKLRRFLKSGKLSGPEAHASWRMIFGADERRQLLGPIRDRPKASADFLDIYRQCFDDAPARGPLNRMLYVDTKLYLPNDMLVKVDRMSMAHGLEARVPYLDHKVVEFLSTVPPHYKLKRWFKKKYILKVLMRSRLPKTVVHRKKQGFNVPMNIWLRSEMKEFVRDHLSVDTVRRMGFLDPIIVCRLLDDHFERRADYSHQIWGLLTLSLWWQRFRPSLADV